MNKAYGLVVFDWEGTLHDTLGQVMHCVTLEAKRLQLGPLDEAFARFWLAFSLDEMANKCFPTASKEQKKQLLQGVQQAFVMQHSAVYIMPGANALIRCLYERGTQLAIATNKGQKSLQRALQQTGLDTYFKVTRSAGQTLAKPAPQMLQEILEVFAETAENALMVGDSLNDVEMAKRVGMDAVGMNFYYQPTEPFLARGALKVFDNYQSLADFLSCPKEDNRNE